MGLIIFIVTYVFIAGARIPRVALDRPGGALLGAVAMVALGVVTPDEVFGHHQPRGAIDYDTILLLLGMMLLAGYLTEAAFFRWAGHQALRLAHSPKALLATVTVVSGVLSAFLVNDTVCLMLTPLVLATVLEARLNPVPYMLAVCMGSNAGSAATFTGNPQNMLIQGASGMNYARFSAFMALPALVSLAIVTAVLLHHFRHVLDDRRFDAHPPPVPVNRRLMWLCVTVTVSVVIAFFLGKPMGWTALTGAAVVMALSGRAPRGALEKVDWVLLLFFASLFVVTFGLNKEGYGAGLRGFFAESNVSVLAEQGIFAVVSLVASNILSNVPFVMLARDWVPAMQQPDLGWQVLALSSTLAGNLTLVGSVANIIVFELARGKADIRFTEYLRCGIPATLLSLAAGLVILLAEHALVGTLPH